MMFWVAVFSILLVFNLILMKHWTEDGNVWMAALNGLGACSAVAAILFNVAGAL